MNSAVSNPKHFWQHFSRVTSSGRDFVPQIDGLRFLAIMAVIAFHVRAIVSYHFGVSLESHAGADGIVNHVFGSGSLGVELFFVISGFILALPFARQILCEGESVNLRRYYVRRVTRLEPPYVIQLLFMFLAVWLVLRHEPNRSEWFQRPDWVTYTLKHLATSLGYAHGMIFQTYPSPNIVLWSLEIEVQFYLLAPLLTRLFMTRSPITRRVWLVGLIMIFSLLSIFWGWKTYLLQWTLLGRLHFFLTGFLLCDLYLCGHVITARRRSYWDLIFICALTGAILANISIVLNWCLPWLALMVCLSAFKGRLCYAMFGHPFLTIIGGMCYTIYMYHWLLISGLIRLTGALNTHLFWRDLLLQFAVMSVCIVLVSSVLFVLFERPFMYRDWHLKIWAKFQRWRIKNLGAIK